MKTIVIASNNAHKAEEIATALAFPGWEFRTLRQLGLDSDPAEDADTFEGNARIKAQAARAASGGLAVLAVLAARGGSRAVRAAAEAAETPPTLVIDAGHGGFDGGAEHGRGGAKRLHREVRRAAGGGGCAQDCEGKQRLRRAVSGLCRGGPGLAAGQEHLRDGYGNPPAG